MSHLAPEIAAFVRVVERGSFAAVASETGYTSSGVSRMISRLESNLGAKLLYRSTRHLSLTPEGDAFLPRAHFILDAIESAGAELADGVAQPKGHIRLNCGTAFANHKLAPMMEAFLATYSDVTLDVSVTDRRVDPVAGGTDVTIRVGELDDSSLIGISIGSVSRVIAASPGYLSKHGIPRVPSDLHHHNCLLLNGFPKQAKWPFIEGKKRVNVAVTGRFASDSAETLLSAALNGVGIVRLGDFLGSDALASGRLTPLLVDIHVSDSQPITALVQPGRQSVPRIRSLLDFLKTKS